MFQKVFEYAGPHKKGLYAATAVVLVSVLMGVLPFVLAYQVIAPLVMGTEIDASFIILRVALVLVCLILQAILYGWGLNLSHKAAYDTLLRLRTALQKRFEKLPLGVIQDKGTGTVKKLFVDDVDSLEVLLAHSMPEGIANLMVPIAVYVAMFFVDWKLALLSLASIPISLIAMMTMYSVGMKKMGPYYMAGQKMNNTIIEYINGMEVGSAESDFSAVPLPEYWDTAPQISGLSSHHAPAQLQDFCAGAGFRCAGASAGTGQLPWQRRYNHLRSCFLWLYQDAAWPGRETHGDNG